MSREKPTLRASEDGWEVHIPGQETPFRVVSWNPPHLVLGRGDSVRRFFVTGKEDSPRRLP